MLAGRRFILRESLIATRGEGIHGTVATVVPRYSVLEIVSGTASGLRRLDVLCDGILMTLFASDLEERGEELFDQAA